MEKDNRELGNGNVNSFHSMLEQNQLYSERQEGMFGCQEVTKRKMKDVTHPLQFRKGHSCNTDALGRTKGNLLRRVSSCWIRKVVL